MEAMKASRRVRRGTYFAHWPIMKARHVHPVQPIQPIAFRCLSGLSSLQHSLLLFTAQHVEDDLILVSLVPMFGRYDTTLCP